MTPQLPFGQYAVLYAGFGVQTPLAQFIPAL
jgi:hypothetical protein